TKADTGSPSPWPTGQRSWRAPSGRLQARTLLGCLRPSRRQAAAAGRRSCEMRTRTLAAAPLVALAALATTSLVAQAPPSVDELLARVGERIAEYYKRAQNVICTEKSTVQPIGFNYSPDGIARTVESELHVEAEGGDAPGEAKVVREIRKVNGRLPRERDKKERDGCTDPNPLSPEPLSFLLPAHRTEYRFTSAGFAKE